MSELIIGVLLGLMYAFVFGDIIFATIHERIHQSIARRLSKKYRDNLKKEGLKFVEEGIGYRSYTFYIMPIHETLDTFKNNNALTQIENELRLKLFKKNKEVMLFLLAPCFPIIVLFLISSLLMLGLELSGILRLFLLIFNLLCCITISLNYWPRHIRKLNRKTDGLILKEIDSGLYWKSAGLILIVLFLACLIEYCYLLKIYV